MIFTNRKEEYLVAKDGTNRGGRRIKAGHKPDPLADKISKGQKATHIEFPRAEYPIAELYGEDMTDGVELEGADMPEPSSYLSVQQRDGEPLGADLIYKETWEWLQARGCEKLINRRLLESYSTAFARFIQCELAISKYGLLGKHPTTGAAIASPFVQLSLNFQKQANLLWYEIYDIVKQNCTEAFDGDPQDDLMERLLREKK